MIALTAVCLVSAGALGVCLYLLQRIITDHAEQRREWAQERTVLLNRIKPETAQPAIGEPEFPSPPGVIPDDDEAFWRSHGIDVSEVR